MLRIGLAGVGRIGAAHARVIAGHPDVAVLRVADVDADRARQVADGLAAAGSKVCAEISLADSVEALLDDVDALVVATATPAHENFVSAGVRRGLPVFCEKPVAVDVGGTLRLRDAANKAGVPVHVGFQRRFDAGYRAARAALRRGDLGTLHRVHMVTADREPPHASYIPTSGGIFRDCHIHDFDVLLWATGTPVDEVYAGGANRGEAFFAEAGDVDTSAALLRLSDGTLVTMQGSRYNGGGYDVRMELAGTRRTYVVGLDERAALVSAEAGVSYPPEEPWTWFWDRFASAYEAEMRAFCDLVRDGGPSPCSIDEALEALYVAEAADLSLREGRPVHVEEVRQ